MTRWRWLFRTAREARPISHLCRTAVQIVIFWGVLLWLLPTGIVKAELALGVPGFAGWFPAWAAWFIFAAASALGLASAVTMCLVGRGTPLPMDCATRLVVRGPYAHIRNPMALAGLTQGVAVGLLLGSGLVLVYCGCGVIVWNCMVRPVEEAEMQARFGAPYEAYRMSVPCWWIRWRAYAQE